MHCVLGAQVNVVCSILGDGGRAIEAQSEFLELLEDAVGRLVSLSRDTLLSSLALLLKHQLGYSLGLIF